MHSVLSWLYTWNPLALHGHYEPYLPARSRPPQSDSASHVALSRCLTGTLFTTDLYWMELVLPDTSRINCSVSTAFKHNFTTRQGLSSARSGHRSLLYLFIIFGTVHVGEIGHFIAPGIDQQSVSVHCICRTQHFAPCNCLYRWNAAFTCRR